MNPKICTTIDQSKKLVELGIDVNTSDMYWSLANKNHPPIIGKYCAEYDGMQLPAWSLSALLELIPKSICIKQSEHSGYFYFLEWQFANDNSLRYAGNDRKCLIDIYSDHDDGWKDNIDTVFEMIVWLKENGKI